MSASPPRGGLLSQRNVLVATFLVILLGLVALNVVRSIPEPLPATPAAPAAPADSTALAARGQRLFVATCSGCHNPQLNPLGPGSNAATLSDAELVSVIINGRQTGAVNMPAFSGILSTADINAVVAYLRSTW